MIRNALNWLTSKLDPPRVIYDRNGASPYLSRWYLTATPTMPDGSHPFGEDGGPREDIIWPEEKFRIYLHKFHRGDDDLALHNHPWRWAFSLILAGGYSEERRTKNRGDAYGVEKRSVRPFSINFIRDNDFHRVDLYEEDAWSLFFVGPKIGTWGFWDRHTGKFMHWRDFIAELRGK